MAPEPETVKSHINAFLILGAMAGILGTIGVAALAHAVLPWA